MTDSILAEYQRRHESFLQRIAENLCLLIKGYASKLAHIDRIITRAKSPSSFAGKCKRTDSNGKPKYLTPLSEIQDILGGRIIVFYREDVSIVSSTITRYFQPIEERELVPESEWAFGYFGKHFVLPTPGDVIPQEVDKSQVPAFFELQIKTLFQHAWSEANHDLGFKARKTLTSDQQRRLAYTAAQAWGADQEFAALCKEITEHGTTAPSS